MSKTIRTYSFAEVLSIVNGKNQKAVEAPNGRYPIYGSGGVMGRANDFLCDAHTVIIGRKGSINNPIYVDEPFWNVDTAFGLVANVDMLFPKYLYYYCVKFDFTKLNTTVTIPSLTKANLLKIQIPLPPLAHQKRIAAVLDKICEMKRNVEARLTKLDLLVKARFNEMFGDPVANPKGWRIATLSDYIEFLTSGSRGWAKYFTDNGAYFITIKNVKDTHVSIDEVQHVCPPAGAEAERTKVQEGDLLISITADLGRTGIVTREIANHGAYINQHLTCIRLNCVDVLPLFVAFYMESAAGKLQFQKKNQSAVKAGLNFAAIRSLSFYLPPLSLQRDFAAFVEKVEGLKATAKKELEQVDLLYRAKLQEYFG